MEREFLLPHQALLISRIDTALEEVRNGSNSQGILFIGASGSGKTHALDVATRSLRQRKDGHQRIIPCCRVGADATASTASIASAILVQLGVPLHVSSQLKPKQLEPMVMDALRACEVQLLIFEELHNALKASSRQLRGQLSRFLKNLWNLSPADSSSNWARPDRTRGDHRLVILASGTDELKDVFYHQEQKELQSRFGCLVEATKLSFSPSESFRAFRGVLAAMIRRSQLNHKLSATDNEVASRTLIACDGHLRVLETILCRSATLERRSANSMNSLELLACAFDEVGGETTSERNPFRWSTAEIAARIKKCLATHKIKSAKGT